MTLSRAIWAVGVCGACSGSVTPPTFEIEGYWIAAGGSGRAGGTIEPSGSAAEPDLVFGRTAFRFGAGARDVNSAGVSYRCEAPWDMTSAAEVEVSDGNYYRMMRYSVADADWVDLPVVTIEHYEDISISETVCVFDGADELVCAFRDPDDEDLPAEDLEFDNRFLRVGETVPSMTCAKVLELTMLGGWFSP